MYKDFFGFVELPFSIVPNSRYLYLSPRHQEAIRHLQSGLGEGGGFAMLTGEVGTGKTTIARTMLKSLDDNTRAGLILNPTFSSIELLQAICDEFNVAYQVSDSLKVLNHALYQFLLDNYTKGLQTLLVIDEAQHLAAEVLEQLRLLTNLETDSRKLLKVLLIGQPELQQKLQMPQLRQLAQRITGRYHLLPLSVDDTIKYIEFRLERAGGDVDLLSAKSMKYIAQQTQGIPRLVNLVCDATFNEAYAKGEHKPSHDTVITACQHVMSFQTSFNLTPNTQQTQADRHWIGALSILLGAGLAFAAYIWTPSVVEPYAKQYAEQHYPQQQKPAVEVTKVPKELLNIMSSGRLLEQGISELYKVWGYDASVIDSFCHQDSESEFHCDHQSDGDLNQLKNLNIPALLALEVDGQPEYAVLYRLDGDKVELLFDQQRVELSREALEQFWQGEYYYIWRSHWPKMLKPGMVSADVAELEQCLSTILGEPSTNSDHYDQQVKHKVELFQRWQKLNVDGIAGQRTLERLSLMTQIDAPLLLPRGEGHHVECSQGS